MQPGPSLRPHLDVAVARAVSDLLVAGTVLHICLNSKKHNVVLAIISPQQFQIAKYVNEVSGVLAI